MATSATSSASNFFTGQSSFSAQLNNVISHAVAQATLPITELQNQQSTLTNQQSEVQTLGADFMAVQSAVDQLNTALSSGSKTATADDQNVATATASPSALPGTYNLTVANLGSQTNTMSTAGATTVADPSTQGISTSNTLTLTVDGTNFTLSPEDTSLDSLVNAINSSGANVQATVVNVGGSSNPDYRLSVQSTQYAPDTIQLSDGSNNSLLSTLSAGSYVTYQVNGQPATPVNSTSRTLSLSTGLSAEVNQAGTTNITVAQNSADISSALSNFVSAYNSAVTELAKNRGQNGGALTGDSLVASLQYSLDSIAQYSGNSTGTVNSLADLGLTFDQNGQLAFDQSTFQSAASSSLSNVINFLGSETSGGFVQSAYTSLTSLTDTTKGTITEAGNQIGTSISNLTSQISAKQAQVNQLQTNLTAQMASADAAISSLQNQLSEMTSLFTAELQQQKNITG